MEMKKHCAIPVLFPFLLRLMSVAAGQSITALTGHNFVHALKREDFFSQSSLVPDPISMMPALLGLPDLPSWMKFVQANESQDGYLYGTPSEPSDDLLQVIALNKNSYQSTITNISVKVSESSVSANYKVELYIKNFNIEEIFMDNMLTRARDAIRTEWPDGGDVFVTRVTTYQDAGKRVPIPTYLGEIVKNGVFIEVGGTKDFSTALKAVNIEIKTANCAPGGDKKPPVTMDTLFRDTFDVDWCSFKLVTTTNDGSKQTGDENLSPVPLGEGVFQPRDDMPPRLDLFTDFILIIVVPASVMVLLVLILSCLFFGFRTKRGVTERQTADIQLQQYSSVRLAADQLRSMSQHRDAPATISSPRPNSQFQPTEMSTPASFDQPRSKLRDSAPPPPYRLPPGYQTDASFRSDDGIFQDNRTADDLYLVPDNPAAARY